MTPVIIQEYNNTCTACIEVVSQGPVIIRCFSFLIKITNVALRWNKKTSMTSSYH